MNILSLFDGAACAMVCLKRAGIPIDTYYGADIKKAAIRCEELISEYYGVKHVQLGDVTKIDYSQLPKIDLLCAGFHDCDYIPCQIQRPALTANCKRNTDGVVIGVLNRSRDTIVYSDKEIATLVQNQPTRAGEGVFVLTNDPSKTPYKRKKIESVFDAGYTAFRCPTQAELARFHTYPVEIMEQFTPSQAQSLMGDGWHCGSIQWLFDKLAELTNPQPKE